MKIQDPQAHRMAQELAELTGQSLTDAVKMALQQALAKFKTSKPDPQPRPLVDRLNEIALRCAALPDYDNRSADEILGYDKHGLPS
ncbi:type II toxin-antitoxin system VapB family antitoxin [Nodosilinea sp. AN01ver1]|uniref:type II toxin-antitoxin system VapB family antitoxin n=1 Tax=Nodosilinea sp. AN01ver1 TaxID=3423362 RepID=UPI003D3155B7